MVDPPANAGAGEDVFPALRSDFGNRPLNEVLLSTHGQPDVSKYYYYENTEITFPARRPTL